MVFPHPVPRIIYGQSLLLASKKLASKIPNQLILFEIIFALMPDTDRLEARLPPQELAMLQHTLSCTFAGSQETVLPGLTEFLQRHRPDELMMAFPLYDHAARRRSVELAAGLSPLVGAVFKAL